jgi:hypothetical protein
LNRRRQPFQDSLGLNPFSINNLICQGGDSFVTIL